MTTTLTAPTSTRSFNRLSRFAPMLDQVADPLGYEAGDANLRRYVGNSPTNATDPSGLEEAVPRQGPRFKPGFETQLLRDDPENVIYQGDIHRQELTLPSERGKFVIVMRPTQWRNSGLRGTITFFPDKDNCPQFESIRLIQAAKFVEHNDPQLQKKDPTIEKIRTAEGWHLDVSGPKLRAGNTSYFYRDHFAWADRTQDGSNDAQNPQYASLYDWPAWHNFLSWTHEFETCAVGVTEKHVVLLGAITWGYQSKKGTVALLPIGVADEPSGSFVRAATMFQRIHGGNHFRQATPTKWPDNTPFFKNIVEELQRP
jgi:hypothetical protein